VSDLGLLASNWQRNTPDLAHVAAALGLPSAAVPEPMSAALIAALGLVCRRRRT
jgi:hypothetical protein